MFVEGVANNCEGHSISVIPGVGTLTHMGLQFRDGPQHSFSPRSGQIIKIQWRSYTQAHTSPGPGEFLSALVNHVRSTYLNRNSIAVY